MTRPDLQQLAEALEGDLPREVLELHRRGDVSGRGRPWRLFSVDEAIKAHRSSRTWVPESAALRFFWTDGQSGLAGVAIAGPVRGTVATVISTRPSYAPRFRSVASFLAANDAADEDDDWEDAMAFDYPSVGELAPADRATDGELVARLERALAEPGDRRHRVACVIAVVPPAQADRLLAFVDDADDELAASACVRLGKLGHAAAVPRLLDVAFGARGVPAGAAAGALATMGAASVADTLARLASSRVPDPRVAASILHAAGVEVREAKDGWQYRDPARGAWRDIPV